MSRAFPQWTDEEKAAYLREHVDYELGHLFAAAEMMESMTVYTDAAREKVEEVRRHLILEAWVQHIRTLIAFFYERRALRDGDVIAADYCHAGAWARVAGDDEELEEAWDRASKEMAHLTTRRESVEERKRWAVSKLTDRMARVVREWLLTNPSLLTILGPTLETWEGRDPLPTVDTACTSSVVSYSDFHHNWMWRRRQR